MANTKTLKTLLLLIFFFAFSFSVYAGNEELFVWTDEQGQTHYSKTKPKEWKVDPTGNQYESFETPEQARARERHSTEVKENDLVIRALEEKRKMQEEKFIHEDMKNIRVTKEKEDYKREETIPEAMRRINRGLTKGLR
jgi:hypothetical protein